jgi:chitin synthase
MKTDLGVVKAGADNKVEVDVPTKDEDIDHEYDRVLKILAKPRTEAKQKRDAATKQEDYYKSFRTRVVLAWLISNLGLIIGILHTSSSISGVSVEGSATAANIYLEISAPSSFFDGRLLTELVLWSVAGLAAFRFTGAVLYLIFRLFQGE